MSDPHSNGDQRRLLFVDDEQMLHSVMERLFSRHGVQVTSCSNAEKAIELLAEHHFDLVLTDFKMPKMDGLELLAHIRQNYPSLKVIMITAHANVQHAVRAMRSGVVDYMPKPFATTELVERVQKHLQEQAEQAEEPESASPAKKKRRAAGAKAGSPGTVYIGEHESIRQLKALLPRVAKSRAPVFINGESGTGKEILARLVHEMSDRSEGPYVTINCANLPRELVESHLFGHRKGAFTGAIDDMVGAFERADGGTLLLDEITEVESGVQAKLLRVLQEQEFQKVGASETCKVDVRVVATSNRDPQKAVQEGAFREDLYHRISVFPLHAPPLRGRLSDIPMLTEYFVDKYCRLYDLPEKEVAPELLRRFQGYSWPGNVRQLENLIHRGVVLAADREVVQADDVVNEFFTDSKTSGQQATVSNAMANDEAMTIEEMERQMILQTLSETDQNQRKAAEKLGISARTIRNKLKKYREEGFVV